MPRVVLFRTPTPEDTYAPTFASSGYATTEIPALTDHLLPADLRPILARGGEEWEATIITSRRAAEAWVQASRDLPVIPESWGELTPPSRLTAEPWSNVPVWSPGPAVRAVFDASGLPSSYVPQQASTAVSAAALAPLILAAPPRSGGGGYRPYLVLTGDKTLPLLTDSLRSAGRDVRRVRVYETSEDPGLGDTVRSLASGLGDAGERLGEGTDMMKWIALFSPSSAAFVLPHLEAAGYDLRQEDGVRVAAIGETTAGALRAAGVRVDAVAGTPDAEGLVEAIAAADAARLSGD